MSKIILPFIIPLVLSPISWATNFFVSFERKGQVIPDHSNGQKVGTLQYYLNLARAGDHVILNRNGVYFLRGTLRIPRGVILRGRYKAGMSDQKLQAVRGFPEDRPMIVLQGGTTSYATTVAHLWADGRHYAWRIIDSLPGAPRMAIFNCKLENTKNRFIMSDGAPYRSPHLSTHLYILNIIHLRNNDEITITGNTLQNAGLGEVVGKVRGRSWLGSAYAIETMGSSRMTIRDNTIKNTLTGGVKLSGDRFIKIENNTITWVGRNREWASYETSHRAPLADGITGYHNQASLQRYFDSSYLKLYWHIANNVIEDSGRHGIHVGGKKITLWGNKINRVMGRGIAVGGETPDGLPPECNRTISLFYNTVRNTGKILNTPFYKGAASSQGGMGEGANIYLDHFDHSVRIGHNTLDDEDGPFFYHLPGHPLFDKKNCR